MGSRTGRANERSDELRASDVIKGMRELLDAPERWTREFCARDANRLPCSPFDPNAACWCLIGAWTRVQPENDPQVRRALEEAILERAQEWIPISTFNDYVGTQHADVLAVLDAAYERAIKYERSGWPTGWIVRA